MKPGLENAAHLLQRDLIVHHLEDAVQLVEKMSARDIADVLSQHAVTITAPLWERLSPDIAMQTIELLPQQEAITLLSALDPTRVVAFLAMRDEAIRERYLAELPQDDEDELRAILAYPTDCAGALMDPRVLQFRAETTIREALARIRSSGRRRVRVLFIVDDANHLIDTPGGNPDAGPGDGERGRAAPGSR